MSMSESLLIPNATSLVDPRTGRRVLLTQVEDIAMAAPVFDAPYTLLVASESPGLRVPILRARAWIDAGADPIVSWGPASDAVEMDFDLACYEPDRSDSCLDVLTVSPKGPISEALFYAFYCAGPLYGPADLIVIVVDSDALAAGCLAWIASSPDERLPPD
jgi:hypothetical protein